MSYRAMLRTESSSECFARRASHEVSPVPRPRATLRSRSWPNLQDHPETNARIIHGVEYAGRPDTGYLQHIRDGNGEPELFAFHRVFVLVEAHSSLTAAIGVDLRGRQRLHGRAGGHLPFGV